MTDVAKVLIAVLAIVIVSGSVLRLVLKDVKAVGSDCIATLAICADVAIKLNPVPACCNPGPAVVMPEAAIAASPVATAAKVPTKSARLRSTRILIPSAMYLTPRPAFLAAFPILSKIPAIPSRTLRIAEPKDSTTLPALSKMELICSPRVLNRFVILSIIGLI